MFGNWKMKTFVHTIFQMSTRKVLLLFKKCLFRKTVETGVDPRLATIGALMPLLLCQSDAVPCNSHSPFFYLTGAKSSILPSKNHPQIVRAGYVYNPT